jgi:glycosyltransferase involved in cell wall biosynthesis
MKICFIADGRSPTANNWIRHFLQNGHEVHVISTYPCAKETYPQASVQEITSSITRRAGNGPAREQDVSKEPGRLTRLVSRLRTGQLADLSFDVQHRIESFEVGKRSAQLSALLREINPDLVHAMRLPFEGILAALADPAAPLLISIWGNDLTLFARRFGGTARLIWQALERADALHADCQRDISLASQFGFNLQKPWLVIPGSGGVRMDLFGNAALHPDVRARFSIPASAPLACNPRGVRPVSVRNDTFFRAAAISARGRPDVIFAAVGMRGNPVAEGWTSSLGIEANMRLLPTISRAEMFALLRTSDVVISPSEHDGTPNTLLESMAAGAFPICGDIESVREWITDGENGKLRRASDPAGFAEAILSALADPALRASAAEKNQRIVQERAEYFSCMKKAEKLYESLVARTEVPANEFS